jgi:hypothetical protein
MFPCERDAQPCEFAPKPKVVLIDFVRPLPLCEFQQRLHCLKTAVVPKEFISVLRAFLQRILETGVQLFLQLGFR